MSEQTPTPQAMQQLVDAITSDASWPAAEKLLRKATATIADEWKKQSVATPLRIDSLGVVKDLCSPALNAMLQQFFAGNHRFVAMLNEKNRRAAVETYDFIDQVMPLAMFAANQWSIIESKKDRIMALDGHILDLGVFKGGSTRMLAKTFPHKTIHGFDSFDGLPEDWSHAIKGTFGDVKGLLPDMPPNVKLYKGWFDDTLPVWFEEHKMQPISLLRVDCDIYSSTKTIFDVVGSLVRSGTCIVLDELIGYRGFKDHEYKAFSEFQQRTGLEFEYVAFGLTYAMGFVK